MMGTSFMEVMDLRIVDTTSFDNVDALVVTVRLGDGTVKRHAVRLSDVGSPVEVVGALRGAADWLESEIASPLAGE